jgi:putative ABC transport system permease protein
MAIEPSEFASSAAMQLTSGDRGTALRRLESGRAVLVPVRAASTLGLNVGAQLPLETLQGPVDFQVVGLLALSFPSADDLGAVVISRADAIQYFGADTFSLLLATPGAGVPLAALAERLAPEAERYGMRAVSVATVRAAIAAKVGSLFLLLGSLVAIGGIVAALAIATTMMMNLAERAQEIRLLRTLGLTEEQVQRMILVEAATLGLIGGLLGLVSGSLLSWLFLQLVRTPGLDLQPTLAVAPAAAILIGAVVLATVAGLLPARRLARPSERRS